MNLSPSSVDVICSVYNPRDNLRATLDSVLEQSHHLLRLVMVDDGSTSVTAIALIDTLATRDPRIHLVRNPQNRGLSYNLHAQVAASSADYIARVDAGDTWAPTKLAQQLAALDADAELMVVGTQCLYVNERAQPVGRSWFGESFEQILQSIRKRRGLFEHSSIVFRRCLNYRPEFKLSQDLDLYLRALRVGKLRCLPEVLTHCEINRSGLTIQKRYLQRKYQALAYRSSQAIERTGQDIPLVVRETWLEKWLWSLAQPFYVNYVTTRTEKRSAVVWMAYLSMALALYPPLIKDYLRKL